MGSMINSNSGASCPSAGMRAFGVLLMTVSVAAGCNGGLSVTGRQNSMASSSSAGGGTSTGGSSSTGSSIGATSGSSTNTSGGVSGPPCDDGTSVSCPAGTICREGICIMLGCGDAGLPGGKCAMGDAGLGDCRGGFCEPSGGEGCPCGAACPEGIACYKMDAAFCVDDAEDSAYCNDSNCPAGYLCTGDVCALAQCPAGAGGANCATTNSAGSLDLGTCCDVRCAILSEPRDCGGCGNLCLDGSRCYYGMCDNSPCSYVGNGCPDGSICLSNGACHEAADAG